MIEPRVECTSCGGLVAKSEATNLGDFAYWPPHIPPDAGWRCQPCNDDIFERKLSEG